MLGRDFTGDRVVAVFSDGALFDEAEASELAEELRGTGIRFECSSLGALAARSLDGICPNQDTSTQAASADEIPEVMSRMMTRIRKSR